MKQSFAFFLFVVTVTGCRTSTSPGLFSKKTPHEVYGKKISDAGLQSTELGRAWFAAASAAVALPVSVNKPYKEAGFFSAEKPGSTGLRFAVTRGEKLQISISRKPASSKIYLDLWEQDTSRAATPKLIASSDTTGLAIQQEIDKTGFYILRVQPELLQDCEYTIEIAAVASLAYPIRAPGKNHTKSFWGVDRDGGSRRHEGIDMFAARLTPVVAAANGRVTRVNMNNLGGKVVWMRPENKNYTLYYAHLDSQLVQDGQQVRTGDTLGLMGNTGNARTTAPHLHFGIYAMGGAIDPFPFVNPSYPVPVDIRSDLRSIGKAARTDGRNIMIFSTPDIKSPSVQLPVNTLVKLDAAADNWYRVTLPGGEKGFIRESGTKNLDPVKSFTLNSGQKLLAAPDSLSPVKQQLEKGTRVQQLALYKNYQFISTPDNTKG
ncbi:MAG: M23 family metallopeptidase, partial [Flavitalea sp.]